MKEYDDDISFYYYGSRVDYDERELREEKERAAAAVAAAEADAAAAAAAAAATAAETKETKETSSPSPTPPLQKEKERPPINNKFDISTSMFRARAMGETDNHDYFDTTAIEDSAFEVDWERCMAKTSFWEFVCGESLPAPFERGDHVQVVFGEDGSNWLDALVISVNKDGTADVDVVGHRLTERSVPYYHLRYHGGKSGGLGGENSRNVETKVVEVFVPETCCNDVEGYRGHQLRSIAHHSCTTITVCKEVVDRPRKTRIVVKRRKKKMEEKREMVEVVEVVEVEEVVKEVVKVEAVKVVEEKEEKGEEKEEEFEEYETEEMYEIEGEEKRGRMFVVEGSVNGVKVAEQLLKQALDIVATKKILRQYYSIGMTAYNYFKATGSGDVFSMQRNEFIEFARQANIVSSGGEQGMSANMADQVFHVVNDEIASLQLHSEIRTKRLDQKFQDFNRNKSIMRFEWQEALLRLAHLKYGNSGGGGGGGGGGGLSTSLSSSIRLLYDRHIIPRLGMEVLLSSNEFRRNEMYTKDTESVIESEFQLLRRMFCSVAGSEVAPKLTATGGSTADRPYLMTINEWMILLNDLSFLDSDFTRREAILCFIWSKMTVVDDFVCSERAVSLTFVEFLECMCRCSSMKTIPTNQELDDAGVIDIVSYYDQKIRKGNRHIFKTISLQLNASSFSSETVRKEKTKNEGEGEKKKKKKGQRTTSERLSMLLLLAAARMKEVESTSALSKKKSGRFGVNKKMSRCVFLSYDCFCCLYHKKYLYYSNLTYINLFHGHSFSTYFLFYDDFLQRKHTELTIVIKPINLIYIVIYLMRELLLRKRRKRKRKKVANDHQAIIVNTLRQFFPVELHRVRYVIGMIQKMVQVLHWMVVREE